MERENEFFGRLEMRPQEDDVNHNSSFNWLVVNPELTVRNSREIEDGDYLEVMDNMGRPLLQKQIYRDYDTYYHHQHGRQLHNGMAVQWVPKGIALDYWINIFSLGHRARLVKAEEE